MKLMQWLDGKKSYIGCAAVLLYSVLIYFQVVQSNELVWGLIASATGASFRLAIAKVQK